MSSQIDKKCDPGFDGLRGFHWFAKASTDNFSGPQLRSDFQSFFEPFQVRFGLDSAPENGAKTGSKRVPKPS